MEQQGLVRLELKVNRKDVPLVRSVARALADPEKREEARAALNETFGGAKADGLKALLSQAPLEGLEATRRRDRGRDVDL